LEEVFDAKLFKGVKVDNFDGFSRLFFVFERSNGSVIRIFGEGRSGVRSRILRGVWSMEACIGAVGACFTTNTTKFAIGSVISIII
jgi:hypothetical protein